MILFYHPDISDSSTFALSVEESKHIAKVLRKRAGDTLHITNGKGFLYAATLLEVHPSECIVQTTERLPGSDSTACALHLAVSPLRNPTRWEWMLEKATEAGVREITPVICHRTERHQIKPERWNKIVVSAMKQSLRTYLPVINPPLPFGQLVSESTMAQQYIAWCSDDYPRVMLQKSLEPAKDLLIMIGPEGDFTTHEVDMALQHRFTAVSLGSSRLRAETAALAACFTFALANNR